MTNAVYNAYLSGIQRAEYNLTTATIKCALVRGYTYSASHQFVSDVTGAGGTLNGTSAALANPSLTNGVFDADDTSVSTTANATNHALIVFQASAVGGGADVAASAQRLIAYFDTGTNFPIQPGTGSVTVTWDSGTNKIVKVG